MCPYQPPPGIAEPGTMSERYVDAAIRAAKVVGTSPVRSEAETELRLVSAPAPGYRRSCRS